MFVFAMYVLHFPRSVLVKTQIQSELVSEVKLRRLHVISPSNLQPLTLIIHVNFKFEFSLLTGARPNFLVSSKISMQAFMMGQGGWERIMVKEGELGQ